MTEEDSRISEVPQVDAGRLGGITEMDVYPSSITRENGVLYFLAREDFEKRVCVVWKESDAAPARLEGDMWHVNIEGVRCVLLSGEASHCNAVALRNALPFTRPAVQGLRKAAGLGDRLGLATPGHVRAVAGSSMVPFFAQQSIREMTRTGRTPEEVMDTATWGVFQEGFRDGFGSDADHLKTVDDAMSCLVAGFTMFTVDPGDHVDDATDEYGSSDLAGRFDELPWDELEISQSDCREAYTAGEIKLEGGIALDFSEEDVARAAVKYGRAVAHTVKVWRSLKERSCGRPFEMEMSVDETATPTSVHAHYFVANELKRLGVELVSLAPRFVGRFEKGVDYIGDLDEFEESFRQHVAVSRTLGPYKLSLHSGSDKFTVYPIVERLAGDLVHLKTAGTSYLEAVRAVGTIDPGFFREILALALERYEEDRATYHVSADVSKVRKPEDVKDDDASALLDEFDCRQVLHVTYGSVLDRFGDRLLLTLRRNEEAHYGVLSKHLSRHVELFA